MRRIIRIQAFKYPNILHYEWEGEILEHTNEYVLVLCKPERKLIHYSKKEVYTIHNLSLEFFSLREWFTVAMQIEHGKITDYYCNIATPSILNGDVLTFIDLDIDLVKRKGEDWKVVDVEEFEINRVKYQYPNELIENALAATESLKVMASKAIFPFDESLLQFMKKGNNNR